MIGDTVRFRTLPRVSVGDTVLLASLGLVLLLGGIASGAILLVPAGIVGMSGFISGLWRALQVRRGEVWLLEGRDVLAAATLVNGSLAAGSLMAAWVISRYGF
jgi:hypothetical protein